MSEKLPRGFRNNNPGNIRKSPTHWDGEVEGDDNAFETYDTMSHGVRALAKILLTYNRKHGLCTVQQIIDRWAPPNENDTDAYVAAVARAMGVDTNQRLVLIDPTRLAGLVGAIIHHENGRDLPNPQDLIDGVRMALQ